MHQQRAETPVDDGLMARGYSPIFGKRALILVCRSNADRTAGAVGDVREATDVMEDLWPCEVCLQGPTSNHPERHWLKTVVVGVGGKGRSERFVR